jgi:flagellar FliL protein
MADADNDSTNLDEKNIAQKKKFDIKQLSKKSWIIIGTVVFVLLLLAVIFFTPIKDKIFSPKVQVDSDENLSDEEKAKKAREVTYLPLPDTVVNLRNAKGRNTFLKASFVLQIHNDKEREHINYFIPVISDQFQTFLREMDVDDIQGAAGIERVRQELLIRINRVIAPFKVKEVLVREFLVQ